MRQCPQCFDDQEYKTKILCSTPSETRQRQWCKEFGFNFVRKPIIGSSYQKELCDPDLPIVQPKISDNAGNCIFSSLYYLIAGEKSGKTLDLSLNGKFKGKTKCFCLGKYSTYSILREKTADIILTPEFITCCKTTLNYCPNDFEIFEYRNSTWPVPEYWVKFLIKSLKD